jgi:hypothetical protein
MKTPTALLLLLALLALHFSAATGSHDNNQNSPCLLSLIGSFFSSCSEQI